MEDKIARYQEIERRGLLNRLPQEKQAIWSEYKSRHPEMFGSSKESIDVKKEQLPPSLTLEEMRAKADEMNKKAGIDTSSGSVFRSFGEGFGKGYLGGIERLAAGATLGASDWVGDKLGTGVKQRREDLEKDSGLVKGLNIGLDIVGGLPTGGALFKGAMTGAKAVPYVGKALKYTVPTATGAISGGLYSGFENDSLESAKKGAFYGGLTAGALDLLGRGASKAWSATHKIDGVKRGLSNSVESSKGTKILKRAVKESDDIAEDIYNKAPEALDEINARTMSKLDDALNGGVDIKGEMAKAKKNYADFVDARKGEQIISGADDLSSLKGTVIVDEAGNPLKVYHGTNNNFDKFKVGEHGGTFGTGIYAGDKNVANNYGNVKELYINSKNPYRTTDVKYRSLAKDASKAYQNAQKLGKLPEEVSELIYDDDIINWYLKNKGYDGIIGTNSNGYNEYIAFSPEQIVMADSLKSAPKVSDLGINDKLSNSQLRALNTAWKQGADSLKKGESIGSLKHIDEMKKSLNKMIEQSKVANPNGVGTVSTSDTVGLQELKGYLKETMDNAGLSDISKQYARAKGLESAFNQGLNFKPNAIKTRNLKFTTPEEKSAFAQGLVEQIKINPESKNIANKARDLSGALKYAFGDKSKDILKEISKDSQSYKRVSSILQKAENKLMTEEPVTGKIGLLRELGDGVMSIPLGLADFAKRVGTAKSSERAAKYLLNPELTLKKPLFFGIQKYLPTSGSLGTVDLLKGE